MHSASPEETASEGQREPEDRWRSDVDDPLLPAAYRLARFYALLSPGILQQELGVDRARAGHLVDLLVKRRALGPVLIERSGARESLINMVNDRAPDATLPPALSIARASAGRAAIIATGVGVALGLALCVALVLSGLALWVAALLGIAAVSPALAHVVGLLVLPAGAGWALGALVEHLFSPDDELLPYGALRVRRALWSVYATLALGFGALQLFR